MGAGRHHSRHQAGLNRGAGAPPSPRHQAAHRVDRMTFSTRVTQLLGVRYPIIQAGMSWASVDWPGAKQRSLAATNEAAIRSH